MAEKRLIDANAMRQDWLENGENECVYDTNAVLDSIDAQPTVDAVEVVRCGLCRHWDVDKLYCHHPGGLSFCGKPGAENGFCCFGERRTDG